MKIVNRMFLKIKVRGNKIFSIVSIFAILANSFAPVLAAIPTYTYAEGITAPVEVLTKEDKKEEAKIEEKIESESVLKEEKNSETESQVSEEVTQGTESEEEVLEENQEGDILEDGVSDYRPEVEITEDEVKEVEEVSVLKETVSTVNEINDSEEVTEATASESSSTSVSETEPASNKEGLIQATQVEQIFQRSLRSNGIKGDGAYTISSTNGIWIEVDGGSNVTGKGTEEIRWGRPVGSQKSGLRFDGKGEQSFDVDETFLIGDFTHFNWPIYSGGAASGATLKVTLNFSNPAITPSPIFTYDFDIEETKNTDRLKDCKYYGKDNQVSEIPCDDIITFPNGGYGEESYTIGDIKYTLKIDGFTNSYPGGSTLNKFVTQEKKNNIAYLVGHLSSVLVERPAISIVKKVNGQDANTLGEAVKVNAGETVNFTYIVQNTGNVKLTGISVTDDKGVDVSCPKTELDAGTNMICTGSATAIAGNYTNIGTVTSSHNLSATDPANYIGVVPTIKICHRTAAHKSPYEVIEPDASGDLNGHAGHTGPIWFPGITGDWGDIIPPFTSYDGVYFQGLNWTEYGQAVYNNDCKVPQGKIIVSKVLSPVSNNNQEFTIVGSGVPTIEDSPTFLYDSDSNIGKISRNKSHTYNVMPGTYNIAETVPTGWKEVENTCKDIVVTNNDTKTCTITNTQHGSLTIVKEAIPYGKDSFGFTLSEIKDEGSKVIEKFNLIDDSGTEDASKTFNLEEGTYAVAEDSYNDWDTAYSCTGNNTIDNIVLSAGESVICTFTNTEYSSISGHKFHDLDGLASTTNDRDPVFGYTIFIDANKNGLLDEGEKFTTTDIGGKYSFTNLKPGTYTIVEVLKIGWIVLPGTSTSLEVTISAGEDREKVDFINVEKPTIQVVKNVDIDGDGKVDQFNVTDWKWRIDKDEYQTGHEKPIEIMPGTYTISEVQKDGYHVKSMMCANNMVKVFEEETESKEITIQSGDKYYCRFTNVRDTGTLIVKKVVDNTNGGILEAGDFSFKIDGGKGITFDQDPTNPLLGENTYETFPTGTYTITEIEENQKGYATSYDNCDKVEVKKGETAVCTITNRDRSARLTVVKEVINDNGGTARIKEFGIKLNDNIIKEFDGGTTVDTKTTYTANLVVRSNTEYSLSEEDLPGYEEGSWNCIDNEQNTVTMPFKLSGGQHVTCTITNDDIAPELELVKEVNNDNGGTLSETDWILTATGPTTISGNGGVTSGDDFKAGIYTLSETGKEFVDVSGYEAGDWDCTNEVKVDANNGITLGLGQSTVCTITNTYIVPACIDGEDIGVGKVGSVTKGTRYDGTPIVNLGSEDRTKPGNALGTADDKFYSLGKDGEIVLEFTGYVENVAGNDFSIHEVTWNRNDDLEENAEVYVRKDNTSDWVYLGEASSFSDGNNDGERDGVTHFDFGSTGLPWITAVKLVESSKGQYGHDDGFDLNAVVAISHVCEKPSVSQVEICKVDNKNRPQEGWDVVLASEKIDGPTSINVIDGSGTNSTSLPAGKYLIKVSGTYRYGNSLMIADAGYSFRPKGIPSGCDCWLDGHKISNGLMALVNGNAVNWGAYNDNHIYTYVYDHDGGKINISILDNIYGDNVNNKNFQFEIFRIPVGYYGTTGGNGCVTLENVLYGDYILDEILKQGWINVSGKGSSVSVDSSKERFTLINRLGAPVTIVATKIVCDEEKYLPNYGEGGPNMTATTAQAWVDNNPDHCWLESGWNFQWGNDSSVNPGDDYVGEADGWNTFGPTDINGVATVNINDFGTTSQIKVREVLKENYFPFTYLTNGSTNNNNVSAEIYCDVDVLNYDNDDRITPEYGKTYYCVAWNVEKNPALSIVKSGSFVDGNSDGYANVGETINYTFTIKNEGNVTLTNVTVTDPKVTVVGGPITLGVGETDSTTFTASYVITQADIDAGKVDNTATADSDESKPTTDDETVSLPQNPALSIVKSGSFVDGNSDGYADVGETINYTFTVKNEGNVTLTNVTVTDLLDGLSAIDCEGKTTLEVGESMTCTATYAVTQFDIDAGRVDNMATAGSDQSEPVGDDETVDLPQNPALSIVKSAEPTTYDEVGDVISYSYVVTNSGNVTLYGIEVEDDKVEVKCPDTSDGVAPLDTITCVASYTITQSDLDNGSVTNIAYATNEITKSDPDSETVEAVPTLSISKSNDSYPTAEKIGNQVRFTIKVAAHRNSVDDVNVYDLFSKGFKYVDGSWTANSSVRGNLKLLGMFEPKYASPASWSLGHMQKDEVVTLTYLAEITDSVIAGVYKDLAWTQGSSEFSTDGVLGYAEETGYVNDSFVGTQVLVEVDPLELKDKISVKEKKVEGEVLGASTLPATGSRTLWVKIVLALLAIGGTLMILGTLDLDKNSNKKGNKKSVKKSLIGLFVLSLFIALSRGVYAASTVVRLSEPKPPVTKEFNLVFVAMDVQDREIVAKCFYKFGDSSYSEFGSDITILSGESGDSRTCFVDKNVLDSDGKYTFKVEATAGGTTVSSNEVVVNYDGKGPGKPEYIKKEKVNDCVNKITLKTSSDGETKYVKVYADDGKEISIKDSNLIETEDLGPDKKFSFEHIVSGDACKKDWYYAVVAFDSADNASTPRSETITKVIETTSGTEEVTEAIPVVGGAGIAGEGGVVAGDQEVATTEGEEAQGTTEEDGSTLEGSEEEGSVLGEQTEKKSAFKSPWLWVVLVGLGIIIVSSVKKGKKN